MVEKCQYSVSFIRHYFALDMMQMYIKGARHLNLRLPMGAGTKELEEAVVQITYKHIIQMNRTQFTSGQHTVYIMFISK